MSPLEQAIRNALERADRANPDVRARLYQSARNALDGGLRKQGIEDPEAIAHQRERLEQTIRLIENEELERLAAIARLERVILESRPDDVAAPVRAEAPPVVERVTPPERPSAPPPSAPPVETGGRVEPRFEAPPVRTDAVLASAHADEDRVIGAMAVSAPEPLHEEEDPAWAAPETPAAGRVTEKRRGRVRRVGSALAALFIYSMILGSLGAGGWWIYSTGIWKSLAERSGNIPDFIPTTDGGDFDPKSSPLDPKNSFSSDWTPIFDPKTGRTIPHDAASVSRVSDSDGDAIQIVSSRPDSDGEAEIEIPAEMLGDLAGKVATFAITTKVAGDQPTQIYVECDFGSLGDCGRHRYTVGQDRSDQLFQLDFTGKMAPASPVRIILNSDVSGKGTGVKVYGVRVLTAG